MNFGERKREKKPIEQKFTNILKWNEQNNNVNERNEMKESNQMKLNENNREILTQRHAFFLVN